MNKKEFVKISTRGGAIVATAIMIQYIVSFATQAALARMLDPKHFGQLAFASMVAMFFNSFTNIHGDKFVVREKKDTHKNLNNCFTLELILSLIFVVFVFLFAPIMMKLLNKENLTVFVQVLAFSYFYNPMIRPRCLLERNLSFFHSKFPFIMSQVMAALIALTMAYFGMGIWSLLGWRLSMLTGEVAIHWFIASYRPKLEWDKEIIKKIAQFGWPLLGSTILVFFYYNIDYYIVGQTLEDGETQLGYYWLAFQMGMYFLKTREILYTVLFPVFSRMEDETSKNHIFQKLTHVVGGVFLIPSMVAIFFGRDIILLVFGSKWEPSIIPFQIIFITVLTRAIHANAGYFLYSYGITRADLDVSIIYSVLLVPLAYFMTQSYGINGTASAVLIVNCITVSYAFTRYIKPRVGVGVLHFFLRPWLIAALTFVLMYLISIYESGIFIRLMVFALLLVAAYFLVLKQFLTDLKKAWAIFKQE